MKVMARVPGEITDGDRMLQWLQSYQVTRQKKKKCSIDSFLHPMRPLTKFQFKPNNWPRRLQRDLSGCCRV